MVICQTYRHFAKKLRSVIVSQNHYLNKIFDVHPLRLQGDCPQSAIDRTGL